MRPRNKPPADADERRAAALSLRAQYESGWSLRDIANHRGYSLWVTRRLLLEAGTVLRKPWRRA